MEGFTKKHHVRDLVWLESHEMMEWAILREKVLKGWQRAWKIRLIEERDPAWKDLYPDLL